MLHYQKWMWWSANREDEQKIPAERNEEAIS